MGEAFAREDLALVRIQQLLARLDESEAPLPFDAGALLSWSCAHGLRLRSMLAQRLGQADYRPSDEALQAVVARYGANAADHIEAEFGQRVRRRLAPRLAAMAVETPPVRYFASGSNHPGEIEGFAAVGHDLGVSASDCGPACEQALIDTEGVRIFVDSGAFSEVAFQPDGPPKVVKPITPARWDNIMRLYLRLAYALGSRVMVVAPDQVGNQAVTLKRLRAYRAEIAEVADLGGYVILPLQGGEHRLAEFERRARAALGAVREDRLIMGIPSKKGATSLEDLRAYVAENRPQRVHLLGLGRANRRAQPTLDLLHCLVPELEITMDSVWIRANVGRGANPRKLTRARTRWSTRFALRPGPDAMTWWT